TPKPSTPMSNSFASTSCAKNKTSTHRCVTGFVYMYPASVSSMSTPFRRPRGTPTRPLYIFEEPDVKDLLDTYASRAGLPQWAILEAAIRAGKPDETGLPANWDLPVRDTDVLPGIEGGSTRKSA